MLIWKKWIKEESFWKQGNYEIFVIVQVRSNKYLDQNRDKGIGKKGIDEVRNILEVDLIDRIYRWN